MKKFGLLAVVLVLVINGMIYAADGILPGSGTEADPYLIEDIDDFDAFADDANAGTYWAADIYTKLMCDIDLSGRVYDRAVIAWDKDLTKFLLQGDKYAGVFDGNEHEITNLNIEGPLTSHFLALFGHLDKTARIESLGVTNIEIKVQGQIVYVGALCGINDGTVSMCYSSGRIFANINKSSYCMSVGGLCGANNVLNTFNGIIINSSTSVNISLTSHKSYSGYYDIGGLSGFSNGEIYNSYSTGRISSAGSLEYTGGLCGRSKGVIKTCYTSSSVICGENSSSIGGFCGNLSQSPLADYILPVIEGSYSSGLVKIGEAAQKIGGFVGELEEGEINNCYTISTLEVDVSSYDTINAFCGDVVSGGIVDNSFWNIDSSGVITEPHPGAEGKTTMQMYDSQTFIDAGWDFADNDGSPAIWKMPYNDYPKLKWEEILLSPDIDKSSIVDIGDFALIVSEWLNQNCIDPLWCNNTDLDKSGTIDLADYNIIAENWLYEHVPPLPPSILMLHLELNESGGSVAVDSSDYGRDGIVYGSPAMGAGKVDGCYEFDGADDYIEIGGYSGVGGSGSRTVSAWINADEDLANSDNSFHTIASWGKAGSGMKWVFMLDANTGQLTLSTYGGKVLGGTDLEDGQWHHVAVVLPDGANNLNQVKMYVDGVEITTNAASLDSEIDTALTEGVLIGASDTDPAEGVQNPTFYFSGALDEVRIYNTELSAAEIAELN